MPRDLIPSEVMDFSEEQSMEHGSNQPQISQETLEEYLTEAREMVLIREQKARVAKREAEVKKRLMAVLEEYGESYGGEGQHRTLDFPKSIRGIARFVRQRKVATTVDETKAEAIARRLGIYDRLFRPVMTLDESAVLVAVEQGLLTDADMAEIFPKKETYSFVAEKKKK